MAKQFLDPNPKTNEFGSKHWWHLTYDKYALPVTKRPRRISGSEPGKTKPSANEISGMKMN
jgi:hypothetical protein